MDTALRRKKKRKKIIEAPWLNVNFRKQEKYKQLGECKYISHNFCRVS